MRRHLALLKVLAGTMLWAGIATHAQAIDPHGEIGMPAPVLKAPGQNGGPIDGRA